MGGWNKLPLPLTVLSAGYYWLAIQTENYYGYYTYTGAATDQYSIYYQIFGAFPPPGPAWQRYYGQYFPAFADSCP